MFAIAIAAALIAACVVRIALLLRHNAQHEIPGTLGFALYVYLCFHVLVGLPPDAEPLTLSPVARIAGAGLFVVATLMFVWCGRLLREHGEAVAALRDTSRLVMGGPYKYVRHPIYTATGIALIGVTLVWPTLFAVAISCLAFGLLALGAGLEDGHNHGVFGDEYSAYMARTKMLVPFFI